jgi:predicted GIY-YIG superfamily endonuclease
MSEVLYRFWGKNKELLYIGISKSFGNRFNQHAHIAEWFAAAETVTIEHYPTRKSVEAAEKKAIRAERPLHNKAHNPDYESTVDHYKWLSNHFFRRKAQGQEQKKLDAMHLELMSIVELNLKYTEYNFSNVGFIKALLMAIESYAVEREGGPFLCDKCVAIYKNNQFRKHLQGGEARSLRAAYLEGRSEDGAS